MDKYKSISAFNIQLSPIQSKKLPFSIRKKIDGFDKYQEKLFFATALRLFLYAVNEEKESLREIDAAFVSKDLQKEIQLESSSYSHPSRTVPVLDSEVLLAIFYQLLGQIKAEQPMGKRNLYPWADFRQTKSGIKLHMKKGISL